MKYEVKLRDIDKKYRTLSDEARRFAMTDFREQIRLKALLAPRLEEMGEALVECFLDRYEADGVLPGDDLQYLDKRIEVLFGNGHGDYKDALDLGTIQEVKDAEQRVLNRMKVRAREMELGTPVKNSTYNVSIGTVHGGAQVGSNNTQNIGVQEWNGKRHIRWNQLKPEVGIQRVSRVGDVEVTEENIRDAKLIGGDPWVELHDATTFGSPVRKYALGLFTPE